MLIFAKKYLDTMLTPNEMINALAGQTYAKVKNIIKPLQSWGIDYFCWQKITFDGKWSILGNNIDWLLYSVDQQFYQHDPSLLSPSLYNSYIYYSHAHPDRDFQNTLLKDAIEKYNIHDGLVIMNKTPDGAEYLFIASYGKKPALINSYFQYLNDLKKFIHHFKNSVQKELSATTDIYTDISALKGTAFYAPERAFHIPDKSVPAKLAVETLDLTQREKECLRHALEGKTAKQIAQLLGISFRTVECHLQRIRSKYSLQHKREFHQYFLTP